MQMLDAILEIPILELQDFSLILNPKKTNMLTTKWHDYDHVYLNDGTRIDVSEDYHDHKWLGKSICFTRGYLHGNAVDSRIAAAMRAFYAKKHIFYAKNVSIGDRLRYFNSTVSQIACFAASSITLYSMQRFAISDERMLVILLHGLYASVP